MIPSEILELLIKYSFRNKNMELELDVKRAPESVIKLAKQFNWAPFEAPNIVL